MNGVSVTERTPLAHGSRILLGNNHLFRLSCPGQTLQESETLMNYEQAMNEISINELKGMPMYQRIQQQLLEEHDAEKEGERERGGLIQIFARQIFSDTMKNFCVLMLCK